MACYRITWMVSITGKCSFILPDFLQKSGVMHISLTIFWKFWQTNHFLSDRASCFNKMMHHNILEHVTQYLTRASHKWINVYFKCGSCLNGYQLKNWKLIGSVFSRSFLCHLLLFLHMALICVWKKYQASPGFGVHIWTVQIPSKS